jgi:hypothetical protein
MRTGDLIGTGTVSGDVRPHFIFGVPKTMTEQYPRIGHR